MTDDSGSVQGLDSEWSSCTREGGDTLIGDVTDVHESFQSVVGTAEHTPFLNDSDDLDRRQEFADRDADLERFLAVWCDWTRKGEDVREHGEAKSSRRSGQIVV